MGRSQSGDPAMQVKLICCGRLKEKFYIDACAEYAKRLGRYCAYELC